MLNYHFEHREPMRWRIALALQVEVKRRKEPIWVGNEMEVERALRGKEDAARLALMRSLGAFWCEDRSQHPPMIGRQLFGRFVGR